MRVKDFWPWTGALSVVSRNRFLCHAHSPAIVMLIHPIGLWLTFISQIRKLLRPRRCKCCISIASILMNASLLKTKGTNCINPCSNVLPLELMDEVPAAEDTERAWADEPLERTKSLHFPNKTMRSTVRVLFAKLDKGSDKQDRGNRESTPQVLVSRLRFNNKILLSMLLNTTKTQSFYYTSYEDTQSCRTSELLD